jgi:hypothetical protein
MKKETDFPGYKCSCFHKVWCVCQCWEEIKKVLCVWKFVIHSFFGAFIIFTMRHAHVRPRQRSQTWPWPVQRLRFMQELAGSDSAGKRRDQRVTE